jgi:hypothetical protein
MTPTHVSVAAAITNEEAMPGVKRMRLRKHNLAVQEADNAMALGY